MFIKKLLIFLLMGLYIYTLTFDIFLNSIFRIPAPLITCLPLIILFGSLSISFAYKRELLFILLASIFYFLIGQSDSKTFFVNLIILLFCSFYFNYFIRDNLIKFKISIILFYSFLFFSTVIMILNHMYPYEINQLRTTLIGGEVVQSPSGITSRIFTFGYQLAALVIFIFAFSWIKTKHFIIIVGVALLCLTAIFFGMQRSVLIVFIFTSILFIITLYGKKALVIASVTSVVFYFFSPVLIELTDSEYDNILSKNERNEDEQRNNLITENLVIYSDFPFGLIFYGKDWEDVTKDSLIFKDGLTSHNAHLLFFTYLGPFLSITILYGLYKNICKIYRRVSYEISQKSDDNRIIILYSLVLSFFAVTLNSMFHNAWLLEANGPTVFLFFSILHLHKITLKGIQKNVQ